tara:strand:- start:1661 stop:1861 length:201 start_codon:yes stop_codon:yes gene_type:complete
VDLSQILWVIYLGIGSLSVGMLTFTNKPSDWEGIDNVFWVVIFCFIVWPIALPLTVGEYLRERKSD